MKLLKGELYHNVWEDVRKVIEHTPYDNPVRNQIEKNFGRWIGSDNLIRLKVLNLKWDIRNDLDETN